MAWLPYSRKYGHQFMRPFSSGMIEVVFALHASQSSVEIMTIDLIGCWFSNEPERIEFSQLEKPSWQPRIPIERTPRCVCYLSCWPLLLRWPLSRSDARLLQSPSTTAAFYQRNLSAGASGHHLVRIGCPLKDCNRHTNFKPRRSFDCRGACQRVGRPEAVRLEYV